MCSDDSLHSLDPIHDLGLDVAYEHSLFFFEYTPGISLVFRRSPPHIFDFSCDCMLVSSPASTVATFIFILTLRMHLIPYQLEVHNMKFDELLPRV